MYNAVPINTIVRQLAPHSIRAGLHVLELFGGIGLGVLRSALAASHKIRCYTYVDKDAVGRCIAAAIFRKLQNQFLDELVDAAIRVFDDRLP